MKDESSNSESNSRRRTNVQTGPTNVVLYVPIHFDVSLYSELDTFRFIDRWEPEFNNCNLCISGDIFPTSHVLFLLDVSGAFGNSLKCEDKECECQLGIRHWIENKMESLKIVGLKYTVIKKVWQISGKRRPIMAGSDKIFKSIPFVSSDLNATYEDNVRHAVKLFWRPLDDRVVLAADSERVSYSIFCKELFALLRKANVDAWINIHNEAAVKDAVKCGILQIKDHPDEALECNRLEPVPTSNYSKGGCSLFMHLFNHTNFRKPQTNVRPNSSWGRGGRLKGEGGYEK